ncbi:metalloendopeptidase [Coemansia brasiliensis]|uniref:Metalloendopeptidase n=1 Tax=Coemansia brasiliensis TaxID=2650707 RepID=A0A9W8I4Q9_9FUNG|nr:metalloendopeptidase [Coemansia brasiliensis]
MSISASKIELDFNPAPEALLLKTSAVLNRESALLDTIVSENKPTFENTFARMFHEENFNEPDYLVTSAQLLDAEDQMLMKRMITGYKRMGVLVSIEQQKCLQAVEDRIAKITMEILHRTGRNNNHLLFTKEELSGLPEEFFKGRQSEKVGTIFKYVVSASGPDAASVMQFASMEYVRKSVYMASSPIDTKDMELLQETVDLRRDKAILLGYSSHAEYVFDDMAVGTPKDMLSFLMSLYHQLAPVAQHELGHLSKLKQAHMDSIGQTCSGFYEWDIAFYKRVALENARLPDMAGFNHYFPLSAVIKRMFAFIHSILGLKFKQIANANAWHEQVELYDVWDDKDDLYAGQLYLDLIARDNKYRGAATFPIKLGFERKDGTREHAAVALVANFHKPASGGPILLSHANLATLFHEMGHVLHILLSRTKWAAFNGIYVNRDFIECPSRMFEHLAWDKQVVKLVAEHYRTGDCIPDKVLCSLDVTKEQFIGIKYLREVTQAIYDLTVYSQSNKADVCEIYAQVEKDMALRNTGKVTAYNWHTVRGMIKGYDATLFVYIWGKAISADMLYSRIYPEGIFNQEVWDDYRRTILQPGGACVIMDKVTKFLKHNPQNEALFKLIGLY